jgi:hypothetical protein
MPCKGGQLLQSIQSILTLVTNRTAHNDPISSSALQIHVGKKKIINESKQTMKLKRFNQNRTTLDSTREGFFCKYWLYFRLLLEMHYTPPAFTIVSTAWIEICRHRLHRHSCTSYSRLLLEKRQGSYKTPTTKRIAFLNLDSMPGINGTHLRTLLQRKEN